MARISNTLTLILASAALAFSINNSIQVSKQRSDIDQRIIAGIEQRCGSQELNSLPNSNIRELARRSLSDLDYHSRPTPEILQARQYLNRIVEGESSEVLRDLSLACYELEKPE